MLKIHLELWLLWLLVGVSGTNVKHNRDLDFMLCEALKKTEAVGTKSQYQLPIVFWFRLALIFC